MPNNERCQRDNVSVSVQHYVGYVIEPRLCKRNETKPLLLLRFALFHLGYTLLSFATEEK